MRFIQQNEQLAVKNLEFNNKDELAHFKHNKLLPNTIIALVVEPSNCGKTNVLLTSIKHPNGLKFDSIYVYSKSLQQPKYRYLEKY